MFTYDSSFGQLIVKKCQISTVGRKIWNAKVFYLCKKSNAEVWSWLSLVCTTSHDLESLLTPIVPWGSKDQGGDDIVPIFFTQFHVPMLCSDCGCSTVWKLCLAGFCGVSGNCWIFLCKHPLAIHSIPLNSDFSEQHGAALSQEDVTILFAIYMWCIWVVNVDLELFYNL